MPLGDTGAHAPLLRTVIAGLVNPGTMKICSSVHSGTASFSIVPYTVHMHFQSAKATIASLWVSGVLAAGIASSMDSPSQWTTLASVGILPPLLILWCWNIPSQSMPEPIQEARR
jgi:hypothetical protein